MDDVQGQITDQYFSLDIVTTTSETQGICFGLPCKLSAADKVYEDQTQQLQVLSLWPQMSEASGKTLCTSTRAAYWALKFNKGCYLGSETLAKIENNRGAARKYVLVEMNSDPRQQGELKTIDGESMGSLEQCTAWRQSYYGVAQLKREFILPGTQLTAKCRDHTVQGQVTGRALFYARTLEEYGLFLCEQGSILFQQRRYEEAMELLHEALRISPEDPEILESLGVALGRAERYEEAIALMEKLIEVNPESIMGHTNLSLYHMKLGHIEVAERHRDLASIQGFKVAAQRAREERIHKELKEKDQERRCEMFMKVLNIDDQDEVANFGLGSISLDRKQWPKAIEHLKKCLDSNPGHSQAYLLLGRAQRQEGLEAQAVKTWEHGLKIALKRGDLMPAEAMEQELKGASL